MDVLLDAGPLTTPLQAALFYAEDRGWAVTPDALGPDGEYLPPTTDPVTIRAWWARHPEAPVLLPAGRIFDVLDVPAHAGVRALMRMDRHGVRLGPVAATVEGRFLFYVAPGFAEELPRSLNRLGWGGTRLDLDCHGEGAFVPAPSGGIGGTRWVRVPNFGNHLLPDGKALIGSLAYACHKVGARLVPVLTRDPYRDPSQDQPRMRLRRVELGPAF